MSFISQHTAAEIERAISSVIADTSGDNAATAQTSLTNTWTIPLWTGNAGFVTVANLTSHVASGVTASDIGLGNVENTALSTWAGSTNLTTLGTITTGTWNGDTIASAYIGSHTHAASDVASGTFADARIAETNVTQHEAALSITESQISDFGSYATTTALSSHTGDTSNPHSVTASQLSDFAEAVDDRVAVLVQDGTGITWTYVDASNTLTGNVSLASFTTSDLSEGTNLYYTDARSRAAISASGDLSYDNGTGVISFSETYGTASELLTALLTVDGTGSSLDADLLDGQEGTYYLAWANLTGVPSTFTPSAHTHASSEITDFQEAVEDVTGNLITAGTNISVSYNDVSGVLTISSTASTDSLDDIGDVTITSASTGDLVRWNGSAWVNYADSNYAASSHTHAASDVTSGTLADARISESSVTQHESALSIASSQISDKASANGVASLDGTGKIPSSQLPAIALSEVFVVASQSAQLALTAQEGDVVVRTDQSTTYIHNGGTAGTMADYTELQTPSAAPVTSVNGYTGAVSLTTSDISEGTNLYYTSARFDTAFSGKDTDDLTEGATNQYFTNARSRSAISLTSTNTSELSYDSSTGVFSYVSPTTVTGANSVTLEVRNTTGSTIPKGAAVYISGHSGSKILIDLADSDASGKYPAIGLAAGAIPNNSDGEVTVYGELAGVNTSSYNVGDVLYLSSTAGALTNTRPTSSADAVQNIGKVARSDSNGIIIVSGSGRANDIPNLTNTHVFIGGASGNEQRALAAGDILSGTFSDARISQSSVTQHVAAIDHDSLLNFVANEHIDWTNASSNFATTGTLSAGDISATNNIGLTTTSSEAVLYSIGGTGYNSALFLSAAGSGKDTAIVIGNGRDLVIGGSASATATHAVTTPWISVSGGDVTLDNGDLTLSAGDLIANSVTWGSGSITGTTGTFYIVTTSSPSDTVPVYTFNGDANTGIGKAGSDQLSLIAGGVEGVRITEAGSAITAIDLNGPTNITAGNLTLSSGFLSVDNGTNGNVAEFVSTITGLSYTNFTNDAAVSATNKAGFRFRLNSSTQARDAFGIQSAFTTTTDGSREATTQFLNGASGSISTFLTVVGLNSSFSGDVRIGTASAIGGESLLVQSTTVPQFRVAYDATKYATMKVASGGRFTIGLTSGAPITFETQGNVERLRISEDAYALGLGTTDIESWNSNYAAIELGDGGAIMAGRAVSRGEMYLMGNAYYDGSYKYKSTNEASQFIIYDGHFIWDTAASGTADSALTWSEKMRLTNDGTLLIGTTSASGSELFKVDGDAVITGTMEATIDGGSY